MSRLNGKLLVLVSLLCALAGENYALAAPKTLRWMYAHGPIETKVLEMIKEYSPKITKRSGGTLAIEIKDYPADFFQNQEGWDTRWGKALEMLESGEADIAQIATDELVNVEPALEALDLPFIFRDHAHVEKVLAGEVGKSLLNRLAESSGHKIHPFAFAFSGGFRVLITANKVKTAEDFKHLVIMESVGRHRDPNNAVRLATFKSFGSEVLDAATPGGHFGLFMHKKINALITTYKEINAGYDLFVHEKAAPRYISDDNLNLFSTIIIMRESAFQQLSKEQQKVLSEEIEAMARDERNIFVKIAGTSKKALAARGVSISTLPKAEKKKLQTLAEPVYAAFKEQISGGGELVKKISEAR